MSPPGRPKGEFRRAQPEGTPVNPPGRPKGEFRRAQPEGTPVSPNAASWSARVRGAASGAHRVPARAHIVCVRVRRGPLWLR